jgi:mono/diheme cytochrome c family protein
VHEPAQTAEWNRGAYLVQGLGHCVACHGARNTLGAVTDKGGLSGGTLKIDGWYAPSLLSPREAGVAHWSRQRIVELLRDGRTDDASVLGPMADVVYASTQHLNADDLNAMATYLQQLPGVQEASKPAPASGAGERVLARGQTIYDQQCAYCHGDKGQGQAGAFPPLAGNRAVLMDSPRNLVQIVKHGGFLPATGGNPRPYGMPPFGHVLDDADITAVLSFIRSSWGNQASALSLRETMK